jgi:hypothetical protein
MSKFNSEFNYRYQIIGETVWAKIQTLHGFLDGRLRAEVLEEVSALKYKAKLAELEHLKSIGGLEHIILNLRADIIETESFAREEAINFALNKEEIVTLRKLLSECYDIAEPTRCKHIDGTPYSDEEMYEVNAVNEFTTVLAREMQAEVIANGRPSAAKIKNAMSNPITWQAVKNLGLVPKAVPLIEPSIDPTLVGFKLIDDNGVELIEDKSDE